MHIKTGTWEANNAVCDSDPLCDPAVLVSPPKPEPHIRNRRLSPGSGSCGGGGGGCASSSPKGSMHGTGHTQAFSSAAVTTTAVKEPRAPNRGRGFRREGAGLESHALERLVKTPQTQAQKERWVGDTLSSLKPPPSFPVKDSPAKLQPAVSYASKVKVGGGSVGVAEEPPGIRVLLQNQWGLSFISDCPAAEVVVPGSSRDQSGASPMVSPPLIAGEVPAENPAPSPSAPSPSQCSKEPDTPTELLLSCHHLVESARYHMREWSAILCKQKKDPGTVIWYNESL